MKTEKWEMFIDEDSYYMWTVKPLNDLSYSTDGQKWFMEQADALRYKEEMEDL